MVKVWEVWTRGGIINPAPCPDQWSRPFQAAADPDVKGDTLCVNGPVGPIQSGPLSPATRCDEMGNFPETLGF